jgi:hypothetical protein
MKRFTAAATILTFGLAGSAQAGFVMATFNGVSPGQGVSFSTNGGGSFINTTAGMFNWTQTGGDYDMPGSGAAFTTFCIEVTQYISPGGSYAYDVVPLVLAPNSAPMGAGTAAMLSELFGRYYAGVDTADEAAAFQVAIWEVVNDADLSVSAGSFRIGTAAAFVTSAQAMLSTLDGTGPSVSLTAISGPTIQDQVFMTPSPGAMACIGFAGFFCKRRRAS